MRLVQKGLLALLTLLLVGCGPTPLYKTTAANVAVAKAQITAAKKAYQKPSPPVVTSPAMYYNNNPVSMANKPQWLLQHISLHGYKLPFTFYINKIVKGTNVTVSYNGDMDTEQLISINYSGTIGGALRKLANITGFVYTAQNKTLMWSDMVSRTFDISFMPGTTQYTMGGQSQQNNPNQAMASGNMVYFGDNANLKNQYSNLHGEVSVWNDLRETLNKLKSKDGQVMVSQATTTVTVYDHPANVEMMANYLKQLNKELSRQVALQVKVLEVDLNKNFNYGINWNLVRQIGSATLGFAGDVAQPVSFAPLGNNIGNTIIGNATNSGNLNNEVGNFGIVGIQNGHWNGTSVLISALKQQGNVSVVTEPRVVTLNNQVAQIGINTLTGYLEQVSTTFTGVSSQNTTQTLTPGVVKSGFSLYILPKIEGDKVFLQITSDIANLVNIQRIQSSNGTDANSIQVPTLNEKTFNQRSVVVSGDTLVIAGFKQLKNEANNDKLFNQPSSQGVNKTNVETVILITPIILS